MATGDPERPWFGRTGVCIGGGIGDVLLHAAHLEAIAAAASDGQLVLFAKKAREAQALFSATRAIAAVEPLARDQSVSGAIDIGGLVGRIRRHRLDSLLILLPSRTIALAAWAARVPRRLGLVHRRRARAWPLTTAFAPPAPQTSFWLRERSDAFLTHLGLDFAHARAQVPPTADAIAAVAGATSGLPRPWIVVGINCSARDRQWGGANFAAVMASVEAVGQHPTWFLFGATDVAAEADAIRAQHAAALGGRLVDLAARPLGFNHALLAAADLYVGNDSLGLNLAHYSGRPAIGVFGPTEPPTGQPRLEAVVAPAPAGRSRAADTAGVGAERVAQALLRRLQGS